MRVGKRVSIRAKRKPWKHIQRVLRPLLMPVVKTTIQKLTMGGGNQDYGVKEFSRALYCKAVYNGDSKDCSLPPKLDQCWHNLILETETWAKVQKELGQTLHHTQSTAVDALDVKNARVMTTEAVYRKLFDDESPNRVWWEHEKRQHQVFISTIGNTRITVCIDPETTTFGDLFRKLPYPNMRLTYAARLYTEREHTNTLLKSAKIPSEATLYASGLLRGC